MDPLNPPPEPAAARLQTDELITSTEVERITGLTRRRVLEAARAGHLTVFRPPAGVAGLVRYGRKSAEALARSMLTPVRAPAPTMEDARDDARP